MQTPLEFDFHIDTFFMTYIHSMDFIYILILIRILCGSFFFFFLHLIHMSLYSPPSMSFLIVCVISICHIRLDKPIQAVSKQHTKVFLHVPNNLVRPILRKDLKSFSSSSNIRITSITPRSITQGRI